MRIASSAACGALLAALPAVAHAAPYQIGSTIANFRLKSDAGQTIALHDIKAKAIVVNFYASW